LVDDTVPGPQIDDDLAVPVDTELRAAAIFSLTGEKRFAYALETCCDSTARRVHERRHRQMISR
jgi:hypothetical protein